MAYELEEDPSDEAPSPTFSGESAFKVMTDILVKKGGVLLENYWLDSHPLSSTNITNMGEKAFAAYDGNVGTEDSGLWWVTSTADKLAWWDAHYNGSVLIGQSKNSVYTFATISDTSTTYYPIGGDGGPNIMVNLGSNWDTEFAFAKCKSFSPRRDGKYLYFEIISREGISFCMPGWVAAYNQALIMTQIDEASPTSDGAAVLGGQTDPHNWDGYLYKRAYDEMDSSAEPGDVALFLQGHHESVVNAYPHTNQIAGGPGTGYDSVSWYAGLIPSQYDRERLKGGSETNPGWINGWTDFIQIAVPWRATDIYPLEWLWASTAAPGANQWLGYYSPADTGYGATPPVINEARGLEMHLETAMKQDSLTYSNFEGVDTASKLRMFSLDNFFSRWEESAPPREDEYNTVYSQLEYEGLQAKYGSIGDTSTMLNARFMQMAHYLATTYIQSVYTFKTIKMPPLAAETITPPNLSSHDGSVTIKSYNDSKQVYSADMYYPSSGYSAAAGVTSPTEVTWATYEAISSFESMTDFIGAGVSGDWASYTRMMTNRGEDTFYGSGADDTTIESGGALYEGDESGTITDKDGDGLPDDGGVDY